jgi:hypothetical protein
VIARLCEVAPDGSSLLLSWGVTSLGAKDLTRATVRLNVLGHRVRAGHRLRLALANSYWPVVWPATGLPAPDVVCGTSRLVLPVWRNSEIAVTFGEPECAEAAPFTVLRKASVTPLEHGAGARSDNGRIRHANGMEVDSIFVDELDVRDGVPSARCVREFELARGDWQTRVEIEGTMTGDRDGFDVAVALHASLNGQRCAERTWRFRFPRRPA